jgi:hypothetical protein
MNLTNVGQDYHDLYRLSLNTRCRGVTFTPHRVDEIKNGPFAALKRKSWPCSAKLTGEIAMQEDAAKTATEWVFVTKGIAQAPGGESHALHCVAHADMAA